MTDICINLLLVYLLLDLHDFKLVSQSHHIAIFVIVNNCKLQKLKFDNNNEFH